MKPEIIKVRPSDSQFVKRLKGRIKSEQLTFLLLVFINLSGLPVLSVTAQYISWLNEQENRYDHFELDALATLVSYLGLICCILSFAAGLLCALKMFSHVHKQYRSDMILSLPSDRRNGFIADYLAGLLLYVTPGTVGIIISFIFLFTGEKKYGSASMLLKDPYFVSSYTPDLTRILLFGALSVIVAMIMFYTISVMCSVQSSGTFGATAGTAVINAAVPLTMHSLSALVLSDSKLSTNPFGSYYSADLSAIVSVGSPLGTIYNAFPLTNTVHRGFILILNILLTLLVFAAAYRLYMKFSPENISKKVNMPVSYVIAIFSFSLILPEIMSDNVKKTAIYFFIAAVTVFIAEFIRIKISGNQKRKYIIYPVSAWLAAFFLFFTVPVLSRITDAFGILKYIPDPKKTDYITIETYNTGACPEHYIDSNFSFFESGDPAAAETAVKINEHYSNSMSDYYSTASQSDVTRTVLNYYLKNGSKLKRQFILSSEDSAFMYEQLSSECFRNSILNDFESNLRSSESLVIKESIQKEPSQKPETDNGENIYPEEAPYENKYAIPLTNEIKAELLKLASRDISDITPEQIFKRTNNSRYRLVLYSGRNYYSDYFNITDIILIYPDSYPHTSKYIKTSLTVPKYIINPD